MGLFTLHNCCASCWLEYLSLKVDFLIQSFLVLTVFLSKIMFIKIRCNYIYKLIALADGLIEIRRHHFGLYVFMFGFFLSWFGVCSLFGFILSWFGVCSLFGFILSWFGVCSLCGYFILVWSLLIVRIYFILVWSFLIVLIYFLLVWSLLIVRIFFILVWSLIIVWIFILVWSFAYC